MEYSVDVWSGTKPTMSPTHSNWLTWTTRSRELSQYANLGKVLLHPSFREVPPWAFIGVDQILFLVVCHMIIYWELGLRRGGHCCSPGYWSSTSARGGGYRCLVHGGLLSRPATLLFLCIVAASAAAGAGGRRRDGGSCHLEVCSRP